MTKAYLGFSFEQDNQARDEIEGGLMGKGYDGFIDEGIVDTDDLDALGIKWEWNEGRDGPALAGKSWLPVISKPGEG